MILYTTRTCIRRTRAWLGLAVLAMLMMALPVSFLRDRGFGLVVEKTPAYGWRISFEPAMFGFEGYCIGIINGHFMAVFRDDVPHAPAPAPAGGWVTVYLSDTSEWLGLGTSDSILGYVGIGRISSGHPAWSSWWRAAGTLFPIWPVSLTAGVFFIRNGFRRLKTRKMEGTLCPVCRYDLRAHKPGDRCPECGTPVEART